MMPPPVSLAIVDATPQGYCIRPMFYLFDSLVKRLITHDEALIQVLFGADNQKFSSIREAMRKGEPRDGEVTLVLERRGHSKS